MGWDSSVRPIGGGLGPSQDWTVRHLEAEVSAILYVTQREVFSTDGPSGTDCFSSWVMTMGLGVGLGVPVAVAAFKAATSLRSRVNSALFDVQPTKSVQRTAAASRRLMARTLLSCPS